MSGSPEHEIGIVDYPGAQVACILGLTDLFGIASKFALDQRQLGEAVLRVTHWRPVDSFDANLSCVYDSAPHGNPRPRTLIIPPTMVDPDDPEVPAGVVSWVRNRHAAGATLVALCSGTFILAETNSWIGCRSPHIKSARRRWRGVFRKSSSTQTGASSTTATSSRPVDSCHGSTFACFLLRGSSAQP